MTEENAKLLGDKLDTVETQLLEKIGRLRDQISELFERVVEVERDVAELQRR